LLVADPRGVPRAGPSSEETADHPDGWVGAARLAPGLLIGLEYKAD